MQSEPFILSDYGFEIYFYFTDPNGLPVPLDPRVGTIEFFSIYGGYTVEEGFITVPTKVGKMEVDFQKNNDTVLWYNNTPTRGVYAPADYSQLPMYGLMDSANKKYLNMTFMECETTEQIECLPDAEIESFLENHYLMVVTSDSFINFDTIQPAEKSIQKLPKVEFF